MPQAPLRDNDGTRSAEIDLARIAVISRDLSELEEELQPAFAWKLGAGLALIWLAAALSS